MNKEKSERHNTGKLRWSLVHFKSLTPLVEVLTFGAVKYSPDNWKKGFDKKELLDSLMRHTTALLDGEEFDSESKLHHIGHIMCNAMFYSFHYVISSPSETMKPKEESIFHEDARFLDLLPVEVKVSKGGITYVKLQGQVDYHYGIDYSKYVELFLEYKIKYEVDAVKTDSLNTVYKLIK